jgi:hypothetical protein
MKSRLLATGGLIVGLFMPHSPHAQGYVFGDLMASCGQFLQAAESERKARPTGARPETVYDRGYLSYLSTVDGYLSGANLEDPVNKEVGRGTDHASRMEWLENYCHANPLTPFVNAVIFLRKNLTAKGR